MELGWSWEMRSCSTTLRVLAFALAAAIVPGLDAPVRAEAALVLAAAQDAGPVREFTLAELEALPQTTIVTGNEFIDGEATYRGPLVRDVIAGLPLEEAEALRFTAANDYSVDIPMSDVTDYDTILAMEANGVRLTLRDKGPLWLMYPISQHPELAEPPYIDRLIWQVVRIEAL